MSNEIVNCTVHARLCSRQPVSAAWAQLGSNMSAEILAEAGFDVLVIDMEHAPFDLPTLITLLQSVKGTGCAPFVRVPWNDMVWIKQVLDAGAYGIHVPYVSTREEAEYAVKSCKYPTVGFRGVAGSQRAVGFGMSKSEYYQKANQEITVLLAIETGRGADNIDEIASVDGVNGIFIGPADLAADLGHINDPDHPEVQAVIRRIEDGARRHNKFLGTVALDMASAKALYQRGYSIVYAMSDASELCRQAVQAVSVFRSEIADV